MKNLVYFLESDFLYDNNKPLKEQDAKQFIIRREILRAIASHNCEDIYHLHFKTLNFLLVICDEMQEWERRSATSWTVTIEEFNADSGVLKYWLRLEEIQWKELIREYHKFFVEKAIKYFKILRCAVYVQDRDIKLISFKIGSKGNYYKFEYNYNFEEKKSETKTIIYREGKKSREFPLEELEKMDPLGLINKLESIDS